MRVRSLLSIPAAALLALGTCGAHCRALAQAPQPEPTIPVAEARVHGYRVEIVFDTAADQHIATVRREAGGPVLWSHRGLRLNLGPATPSPENPPGADSLPPGTVRDLDNDGTPELILREWTGGAHCCFTFFILSLGPQLRVVDSVPLGHMEDVEIVDVDGDGRAEIRAYEWAFAYWNESFLHSPHPTVILSLGPDGYGIAPEMQRRPAWTEAEMRERVTAIRAAWPRERLFPPRQLWGAMLDLVYGGQANQVPALLDCTWKGDALGREVFARYVRDQLYESPWYEGIDALNDGTLTGDFGGTPRACPFGPPPA